MQNDTITLLRNEIKCINSPKKLESLIEKLKKLADEKIIDDKTLKKANQSLDKQCSLITNKMQSPLNYQSIDNKNKELLSNSSKQCLTAKAWLDTLHDISPNSHEKHKEKLIQIIVKTYEKGSVKIDNPDDLNEIFSKIDQINELTKSLKDSIKHVSTDKKTNILNEIEKLDKAKERHLKPIKKIISNIVDTTEKYCHLKNQHEKVQTRLSVKQGEISAINEKIDKCKKSLKKLKKDKIENNTAKNSLNTQIQDLKNQVHHLKDERNDIKASLNAVEKSLITQSKALDRIITTHKWDLNKLNIFSDIKVDGNLPSKDELEKAFNQKDSTVAPHNKKMPEYKSESELTFFEEQQPPTVFSSFLDNDSEAQGIDIVNKHKELLLSNPSITEDHLEKLETIFNEYLADNNVTSDQLNELLDGFSQLLTPNEYGEYWHYDVIFPVFYDVMDEWVEFIDPEDDPVEMLYNQVALDIEKLTERNKIAIDLQEIMVKNKNPPTS